MLLSVDPSAHPFRRKVPYRVALHITTESSMERKGLTDGDDSRVPTITSSDDEKKVRATMAEPLRTEEHHLTIQYRKKLKSCCVCNRGTHLQWKYANSRETRFRMCQGCARRKGGNYRTSLERWLRGYRPHLIHRIGLAAFEQAFPPVEAGGLAD